MNIIPWLLLPILLGGGGGEARPPAQLRLPPGPVLYEGTLRLLEASGAESVERSFQASLLIVPEAKAGSGAPPGGAPHRAPAPTFFAVRRLVPGEPGKGESRVVFERVRIVEEAAGDAPPRLEIVEDPPMELEDAARSMETTFPLELLPSFPVGSPARGAASEPEVSVLGLATVRLPLVADVEVRDGKIEARRSLAPEARPSFPFEEKTAKVVSWKEVHVLDAATGHPLSLEKDVGIELPGESGTVRVERHLTLRAREAPPGGNPADPGALSADIEAISKAMASVRPSKEIAGKVREIEKGASGRGPAFEAAAKALSVRLAAYRELFEEDEDGRKLASLLGSPAPDFTLEGLDGKQASFRELIRGKAALLTFWGYG